MVKIQSMHQKLFPELSHKIWLNFDLGYLSTLFYPRHHFPHSNPLLQPDICNEWVKRMHGMFGCDFSYGGYSEDRTYLWRNSYLTREGHTDPHGQRIGFKTKHLGIDFNVPAGTVVHSPRAGRVIDVFADPDTEIGWGGRVIVEYARRAHESWCLVFGHLSHNGLPQVGDEVAGGDVLGVVGDYPDNGNLFHHLHVQQLNLPHEGVTRGFGNRHSLLNDLDGYGYLDVDYLLTYPDPTPLLM